MKRVRAIHNARASSCGARKFQCSLDRLGPGIREEHLVQVRNPMQQALSQHASKRGEVELHEIGKLGVEHPLECLAHCWMVASEGEHSPATEQVQITLAPRVIKIL